MSSDPKTAGVISTGQLVSYKGKRWMLEGLSRDGRSAFLRLIGNAGVVIQVPIEEVRSMAA